MRRIRTLARHAVPLGRLYDPLGPLAERVYQALAVRSRVLSVDGRGRVFVDDAEGFEVPAARVRIGTYDVFTLITTIEADLRHALRQRASRWIVDWDVPVAAHAPRTLPKPTPTRVRRRGMRPDRGFVVARTGSPRDLRSRA